MKIPLFVLLLTMLLASVVKASCPVGDLDGDCEVNAEDLQVLAEQWLEPSGGAADLNGDDEAGMADFALLAGNWHKIGPTVVINEIHYDPDVKTELVEFVELHNPGPAEIDLSGWYFSSGISYEFPPGSILGAGGYVIVAYDPNEIYEKWSGGRFSIPPELVFGPFKGKLDNDGENIELCNADGDEIDQVDYQLGFPWPTVGDAVPDGQAGAGHSIQLVNPFFDNDLAGSWRSAYPTPAVHNEAIYTDNIPPHIRQVRHRPRQPTSGEAVTITAKVTDSDGVQSVMLLYQLVNPGSYISINDPQYWAGWNTVAMHDDGLDGDEEAGDDIYTFQIEGFLQTHRRLVRYRIVVVDADGRALVVPYPDDPQPNFAYFVYDGAPAWSGAIRPGVTPVVEYSEEVMRSLPVYHLISKRSDVENCTWFERYGGDAYKWPGTLVYEDRVYDHIRYRARGGVWRYAMGKNMWKFDFNRGHSFQARDDYDREYETTWDKLNLSACIQQGDYQHRGEQGMFEAITFKLFNMAGVPAPKTNWLQFRIIDEAGEFGPTQYDGDFWGLYMTLEQMDGRFLNEHNLPDGNLYKMEGHNGDLNNQGPTAVTDGSDLYQFKLGYYYDPDPTEQWWQDNVDLQCYYSYRAVVEGTHHGDVGYGKNYFFHLNPETNIWSQLPWDVDLTWANNMYGDGEDPFRKEGRIHQRPSLFIEFLNRLREFHDLLYNSDQMNQLLDEFASVIDDPSGGPSIVDADRAMWDYNPVMTSGYVNSSKAGQGRFYQKAATKDFPGMVQIMKDYVVSNNREFDTPTYDPDIPDKPTVTYIGPEGFGVNALTFETSPFSDRQGSLTFAAMKWRIAEVEPFSVIPGPPPGETVLVNSRSRDWKYFKGTKEPSNPVDAWRQMGFDDSAWYTGQTSIGYGDNDDNTVLNDMRYYYSTVYLRHRFTIPDLSAVGKLKLDVYVDDGCIVWINGTELPRYHVSGGDKAYNDSSGSNHEAGWESYTLPEPYGYLVEGTNVIAVHALNQSLSSSSDFSIDVKLYYTDETDGGGPGGSTTRRYVRPGKYEIDAVWESGEIAEFNSTIRIPASAVRPGRTYRVRCRMKDWTGRWSHWSDPNQFVAGEPLAAGILDDLRITEVMYNPPDADATKGEIEEDNNEFEFIELKNTGDETLDLSYVSFIDGVTFDFSGSSATSLAPGDFVLVVKNRAAFESRYGTGLSGRIAGEYPNKLANGGENITLLDFWNGTVAEFEYNDGRGWPLAADGAGHSLVPLDSALQGEPEGSLEYGGNWRASTYIGGSPGHDDPAPLTTVVINEVMAHTDFSDPLHPEHDSNDWIELYNTTAASVNLQNWYLSDDIDDLKKWAVPAVAIAGHGRVSFDEVTDFHNPVSSGFGLDKAGEQVLLSYLPGTSEDRVVDCVRFKGQENNVSLGRWSDGSAYWFAMVPSRDSANTNPSLLEIVIDELMYHPVDSNDEYLELYNPTAGQIDLENTERTWRLDGGVDYAFPSGASIPAGGRLLVVGFDPAVESSRLAAFVAAYDTGPLTPGVDIVGPWTGNLSNASERIALERPQPADQPGDSVSWVIVDEAIYADISPWPEAADGTGDALQRIHVDEYHSGNDPSNWQAASPTPNSSP